MHIRRKRGWELPESAATPEAVYLNRRDFAKGLAAGSVLLGMGAGLLGETASAEAADADPSAKLYPFKRNETYKLDRALTPADLVTSYNNYYEFGSSKDISDAAQALPIRPWTVAIDGMVEKPVTIGIDDLLAKMPLEERLYRHRCVEAWSMTVPWSGFALKALVEFAKPQSGAQYVQMTSFENPDVAEGQQANWYPWPYIEGLTMAEATNDLAFLVTGAYGKPVPKQNGAPLRLATPWKYGFWANVNPEVPHPRWSQAYERVLGSDERVPTLLFNGYGEYVAGLYKDLQNERLYA